MKRGKENYEQVMAASRKQDDADNKALKIFQRGSGTDKQHTTYFVALERNRVRFLRECARD